MFWIHRPCHAHDSASESSSCCPISLIRLQVANAEHDRSIAVRTEPLGEIVDNPGNPCLTTARSLTSMAGDER